MNSEPLQGLYMYCFGYTPVQLLFTYSCGVKQVSVSHSFSSCGQLEINLPYTDKLGLLFIAFSDILPSHLR